MITILTKSANYDPQNIKFFHNLSYFCVGNKIFPVLLSVRALLARLPKHNKGKVVSGSRVTLPVGLNYNSIEKLIIKWAITDQVSSASFELEIQF